MFKKYNLKYELDDPRASLEHRDIILNKPYLKRLYKSWYKLMLDALPEPSSENKVVELGSGGGFLKEINPQIITSDIQPLEHVDLVINAEKLPFKDQELSGMLMLNVFHHIPNPALFLKEAERTLRIGGKIVMIEPANSLLARFIYQHFHHEPFLPDAGMTIEAGNPMSNSNQALPYIYFEREKDYFSKEFPKLKVARIKYHTPFLYILSGGVSRTALLPVWSYQLVQLLERLFQPLSFLLGLFCFVEIEKAE